MFSLPNTFVGPLTLPSRKLGTSNQLRDTNAVTEQLHTQLYDLRSKLYSVERERDLSQLRVEMMQMHGSAPNPAPRHARHRHKPKQPSYTYYPDGGQSVIWHFGHPISGTS
ncbi:hypothetical protein EDB19DRAFT_1918593 [Suillus lakei]|nr:hypothetical protein EDB19DRAFT_1918593 [Suillus lakei]